MMSVIATMGRCQPNCAMTSARPWLAKPSIRSSTADAMASSISATRRGVNDRPTMSRSLLWTSPSLSVSVGESGQPVASTSWRVTIHKPWSVSWNTGRSSRIRLYSG